MNLRTRFKSSKSSTAPRVSLDGLMIVVLLLACAALSFGCVNKDAGFQPDNHDTTFVLRLPEDQADETQATAELVCDLNGTSCPPALAMMLTRTSSGQMATFKQCTSFLVAPDIMATNAHCLPEALRPSGTSCKQVQFYFGASKNSKPEIATCSRILNTSDISEDPQSPLFLQRPDYAFLKIARPLKRTPLVLSRAGLADGAKLNVLAVDPENRNGHIRGILRLKTCRVTQSNFLNPRAPGDFADVMSGACKIVHGNSGSPILDGNARVRGILQGSWMTETIKREAFQGITLPKRFGNMSVFTNVACVEPIQGALADSMHSDCAKPHLTLNQLIESADPGPASGFDQFFSAWSKSAPRLFKFKLRTSSEGSSARSFPELDCVQKSDLWIKSTDAGVLGVDAIATDGDIVTTHFKAPVFGRKTVISSAFRVSSVNGVIEIGEMNVTIDLASMRSRATAKTKVELVGELTRYKTNVYDLPVCTP